MKMCERNKKTIHFKNVLGTRPIYDVHGYASGEYETVLSEMQNARMSISPNKGSASVEMFGSDLNYSRTLITENMNCTLKENSVVWVDNDVTEPYDYIVVAKAPGLTNISYAIRKVDVSDEV